MSTNEKTKPTDHAMEVMRMSFDQSMINLPKGISDSVMMVATGIDFLIKYDVDVDAYKTMITFVNDGMDTLNKCINDLKNIYIF